MEHRKLQWRRGQRAAAVMIGACVALVCMTYCLLHRSTPAASRPTFATLTANIHAFQPYQFGVLDGFVVQDSTVSYSQGVLVFALRNGHGQSLAVAEQLLPESVVNNVDPKATSVAGADGSAVITYHSTTTIGALFSTTHHSRQTLVLISTSDPISQDIMQDLLRGLRPTPS